MIVLVSRDDAPLVKIKTRTFLTLVVLLRMVVTRIRVRPVLTSKGVTVRLKVLRGKQPFCKSKLFDFRREKRPYVGY